MRKNDFLVLRECCKCNHNVVSNFIIYLQMRQKCDSHQGTLILQQKYYNPLRRSSHHSKFATNARQREVIQLLWKTLINHPQKNGITTKDQRFDKYRTRPTSTKYKSHQFRRKENTYEIEYQGALYSINYNLGPYQYIFFSHRLKRIAPSNRGQIGNRRDRNMQVE